MAEMTRELFESGIKFFQKSGGAFFFISKKGNHVPLYLELRTSVNGHPSFFANVSKVDSKGFNFYSDSFLGNEIKSRVSFSDLIAIVDKEVTNESP